MRIWSLLPALALLAGCSLALDLEELAPSQADGGSSPHCSRREPCDVAIGQSLPMELAVAARRAFWITGGTITTVNDEGAVVDLGIRADRLRAFGDTLFAFDLARKEIIKIDGADPTAPPSGVAVPSLSEPVAVGFKGVFWSALDGSIAGRSHDLQRLFVVDPDAGPILRLATAGQFVVWGAPDASQLAIFTAEVQELSPSSGQKLVDGIASIDELFTDSLIVAWLGVGGTLHTHRMDGGGGEKPLGVLRARTLAMGQVTGTTRLFFVNPEGEIRSIKPDGSDESIHAAGQDPESRLAVFDGLLVWASAEDGYIRSFEF